MSSDIDKTQRGQQQSQMEKLLWKESMDSMCNRRGMVRSRTCAEAKSGFRSRTEQQIKYLNDALDTIMTNNMRQHMKDELRTLSKNIQTLRAKLDYDRASQRFRMKPERSSPKVTVRPYRNATTTITFTCCMTQLPVNLHDATTGHKL